MLSRKQVRDMAYQLIFQYQFATDKDAHNMQYQMAACADMTPEDAQYLDRVYFGVVLRYHSLRETIGKYAKNFKVDRIAAADMAAMLLALYEMRYEDSIPLNVSIAQAVELVKLYSTEKSYQFVNGILSAIYKDMQKGEMAEDN